MNETLKRLYVVRVVREAYVRAENEGDAAEMGSVIDRWETPEVEVSSRAERLYDHPVHIHESL